MHLAYAEKAFLNYYHYSQYARLDQGNLQQAQMVQQATGINMQWCLQARPPYRHAGTAAQRRPAYKRLGLGEHWWGGGVAKGVTG